MSNASPFADLQRRRWLAAAPALGLLASPALRAQTRLERPRVTLAVGGLGTLYYLPLTIAQQLNFFGDEGLSVDLQDHPGGGPAEQAMVSGHADLVAGAYEHTVILRQRGVNCRAFALLGRAPQTVMGVSGAALPEFRDARHLRGLRIGISALDSATQWFARLVLARAGVGADEVRWVGVGTGTAAAAALQEGRIEAIANVDPVISRLEFRAQIRVIADARSLRGTQQLYGGPMPGGCLYAPQGFMLRYPNTVQALANGVVRALKWLQTAGPSDIVRAVPESAMSGDRAIYLSALDKVREAFSPDGLISEPAVMTAHELVARHVPASTPVRAAAPASTYTNEFAQRAKARFGA
ncbi:MAG: ABC transporter substrate-binding protein [Burkholderiaceae bacterium]